ncbi:uncharacterized protein LOC112679876 [Sipha flava]|uniref:Uncharacterized protein LOC112679876 n=1 Tax=Sipha flava TaxID=143950 RepID=A0A8B8F4M8_9HEMI|nr:uncharacterized protein LOC112679876 [Sipha flava]
MEKTIQNLNDALISSHELNSPIRFISQLKLLATRQLAEECDETIQSCFSLFQCSPLSPTMCEDTNMPPSSIDSQVVDEIDGPLYFNRPSTPTYAVQATSKVNRKLFL